jgi:hypothetical protein
MKYSYFEYCQFETPPRILQSKPEVQKANFAKRAAANKGVLYGCWRSMVGLGLGRDEGIAMTAFETEEAARAANTVEGTTTQVMRATIRPTEDETPESPGVYVFRWFKVAAPDWPAFRDISDAAWPNMEAVFDTRIHGFWQSLDSSGEYDEILLLTRYADLSVWEASRWWNNPVKEADESMLKFRKRNDLIARTLAYPSFLIGA